MAEILRWGNATGYAGLFYSIQSDEAVSGTFVEIVGQNATAPYASPTTTLAVGVSATDTTLTLDDDIAFAEGDVVLLAGEPVVLGPTDGSSGFTDCTRGAGPGVADEHSAGATILKLHESYSDDPTWGSRHVIRYRIVAAGYAPMEIVIVNPPVPPSSDFCTVWGILEDGNATPISEIVVFVTYEDSDGVGVLHNQRTGETIDFDQQALTVDDDGFFSFAALTDEVRGDNGNYVLMIPQGASTREWDVLSVPSLTHENYLET